MKPIVIHILTACLLLTGLQADIIVPGADGSDGPLNITANTEIDLSQAVTGTWDDDNTANAGKGVYDAQQWAVVFKYSSVTVAAGATVTFKNHPSRAPVVWLVNGDVTIEGTIKLNGQNGISSPNIAEPGPGGFRGGAGYYGSGIGAGAGLGFSGGSLGNNAGGGGLMVRDPSIVPLVGGAGGGGHQNQANWGGGAGGGAILLACTGTARIDGLIQANGGGAPNDHHFKYAGGGAGGAIRVLCSTLEGDGTFEALGKGYSTGSLGRIRIERVTNQGSVAISPDPSVVPLPDGTTATLWPGPSGPTVRILSIGTEDAPADPRSAFGAEAPDVSLPEVSSAEVILETIGVEQASQVEVRIAPRAGGAPTVVAASFVAQISTDPLTLHWSCGVPVMTGFSSIQAKVIRP